MKKARRDASMNVQTINLSMMTLENTIGVMLRYLEKMSASAIESGACSIAHAMKEGT